MSKEDPIGLEGGGDCDRLTDVLMTVFTLTLREYLYEKCSLAFTGHSEDLLVL